MKFVLKNAIFVQDIPIVCTIYMKYNDFTHSKCNSMACEFLLTTDHEDKMCETTILDTNGNTMEIQPLNFQVIFRTTIAITKNSPILYGKPQNTQIPGLLGQATLTHVVSTGRSDSDLSFLALHTLHSFALLFFLAPAHS